MSLEDRIHYSMQHMKYSSRAGVLNENICLIKCFVENENFWEKQKEQQKQCNCEKNHNSKEHTEKDDEEFTKIKKQLEVLKQYISDEIKNTIDNMNFWYENQPDGLVYAGSVAYSYKGEMPVRICCRYPRYP